MGRHHEGCEPQAPKAGLHGLEGHSHHSTGAVSDGLWTSGPCCCPPTPASCTLGPRDGCPTSILPGQRAAAVHHLLHLRGAERDVTHTGFPRTLVQPGQTRLPCKANQQTCPAPPPLAARHGALGCSARPQGPSAPSRLQTSIEGRRGCRAKEKQDGA